MSELFMGVIWTVVSVLLLVLAWSTGDVLFIAVMILFVAVGLFLLVTSMKKMIANRATKIYGAEAYGIVVDISPSNVRVNNRPVLNADVVIVEENGITGRYTESIGTSYNKYRVGDFLFVKYYNDDINIIRKVTANNVPQDIKDKLQCEVFMPGTVPYVPSGYMDGYSMGFNGGYPNYNQSYPNYNQNYQGDNHFQQDYNGGYGQRNNENDTVVINGVEYVKKR